MLWLLLIGVLAVLMFVIFYKRPVNMVVPTYTDPLFAPKPAQDDQAAQPGTDLNDLFKPRPTQPPSDQPRA